MKILYLILVFFKCTQSFEDVDVQNENRWDNKLENDAKNKQAEYSELYKTNVLANLGKTQIIIPPYISEYFIQLIENGKKKIKLFGEYIKSELAIEDDLIILIERVNKFYEKKVKTYISHAVRQEPESSKEHLILDIVSFSNLIFHNDQRKMLQMIIEIKAENASSIDTFAETIDKQRKDHMSNEMNYLCVKINICRRYPGFIDNFSDLLNDVLKLDDNKLIDLKNKTKQLLEVRINFFKSFINEDVLDLLSKRLQYSTLNTQDIKNLLTFVTSTTMQRYRLITNGEKEMKSRIKALRLLLDIIDKAFANQADDLTTITLDTTAKAIQQWKEGFRSDIDMPLKLFVEHIVSILRIWWDIKTREEVMALVDIIVHGHTDDVILEHLFTYGSSFLE
ncbi:hypothetical protein ACJJTC_016964 [Scirpophaga incertulas]